MVKPSNINTDCLYDIKSILNGFVFKSHRLYLFACLWLWLPCVIFLLGWFRPWISIPLVLLMSCATVHTVALSPPDKPFPKGSRKRLAVCNVIIVLWVVVSGIGGYVWQDMWDHVFRNGLFLDLVNKPWPVTGTLNSDPAILCYYFAFWLPSALLAKLTGSLEAGYAFQLIYAVIGVVLALLMMFRRFDKISLWIPIIFIFFSGWDYAGDLLLNGYDTMFWYNWKKDLCYGLYSAPSATVGLYYIYNQAIAVWIVMLLLIDLLKKPRILIFCYSLISVFSPIAAFALAIPMFGYFLKYFKSCISWENVCGLLFGLLTLAFYSANSHVEGLRLNPDFSFGRYAVFILLSYGVFMTFVWKDIIKDSVFWWLFGSMCLVILFKLGSDNDLAWRATMPSFFYLMLKVMRQGLQFTKMTGLKKFLFVFVIGIGALSSAANIAIRLRGHVKHYIIEGNNPRHVIYETLFNPKMPHVSNFIGTNDGLYMKYLMKDCGRNSDRKMTEKYFEGK